eukprot:5289682-Amphidinium_carterae.2
MMRVRGLGLLSLAEVRIVKSLYRLGLPGAEVCGLSNARMNDIRISARKTLGKGADLQHSKPLELIAYGEQHDPYLATGLSMKKSGQTLLLVEEVVDQ